MLKNYFKTAWRNLLRNKSTAFINIFGLSVGICSCLLIFLYVKNELSYDVHHKKADRIFRVTSDMALGDNFDQLSRSSFSLSPMLLEEYPEVEKAIRVMPVGKQTIWFEEKVMQYEQVHFSDPEFFHIFDYDFIEGDPVTSLSEIHSIVISDRVATDFFGTTENVLGKILKFTKNSYKITGVFKENQNSHLGLTAVISISSLDPNFSNQLKEDWFYMAQTNYLLLNNEKDAIGFEEKLADFSERHIDSWLKKEGLQGKLTFHIQPLKSIHLDNHLKFEDGNVTNKSYLYIFSVVAIIILLIACINYMNLATAKSAKRAKETGIRKTSGATRSQLIFQFLSESVLTSLFAIILALVLVELLLPFFNELTGKSLSFSVYSDPYFLLFLFFLLFVTGVLAGSYPAFVLSSFKPINLLKTKTGPAGNDVKVRKTLVVLQFAISSALIIGTALVYMQMHYMKNKEMGFDKEQLLVIKVPVADTSFVNKLPEIRNEFTSNPAINKVAGSNNIPGNKTGILLHYVTYKGQRLDQFINFMVVDYDYFDILGLKLKEGRFFSPEFSTDKNEAFIINEAARRAFGWEDLDDLKLGNGFGLEGKIIGVLEDFNYASLHSPIEPLIIFLNKGISGNLIVKLNQQNLPGTLSFIEEKWKMFSKKYPMEYYFLDENFDKQYQSEEKMLTIFSFFSILTIIIACLGLYGLASYSVEIRTKEIGIRKVMGANVGDILLLINKDFISLIIISFVIAFPVAWYAMDIWLRDFAYRIEITAYPFIAAGITAILIAIITISIQALKAAWSNPVEAIKYE